MARFRSPTRSKIRLCSANHRPGCWSNLPCNWPSTAWAYSDQETENGPLLFMFNDKSIANSTDANVNFPAVSITSDPINLALHKPAWTTTNDTTNPPNRPVDEGRTTYTYIVITSAWPFLAVDLGERVTAEDAMFRLRIGEWQVG